MPLRRARTVGVRGKVALITGAASGIGRALADELAARGAEVVLADRQEALAAEAAEGIKKAGGRATAAPLDVRDPAAFEALAAATVKRAGRIDYLFNNAGIAVGGEADSYELADWDDVFDVNLRGVTHGIHAVYPRMIAQGSGHIVNTASIAGLVAAPGEASYTASKHAVVALSKALRIEGKRHGVRVSTLCPGAIRTPILTGGRYGRTRYTGGTDADILELWERVRPMPAPEFARRSLDAVMRNEAIIVVPAAWRLAWWLDRISPELSMRVWSTIFERLRRDMERKGVRPAPPPPRGPEARV
jgi:NAD(P)-dependent dehydrogenase (short-subunit alcohol dehydrogenase family)